MMRTIFSVAIGLVLLATSPNNLFGQLRMASGYGEVNIGGQRIIVHATVAVPPGVDGIAVAEDVIRAQGARPFRSAEFATTGLLWDQFSNGNNFDDVVVQSYNPSGEPVAAGAILQDSQSTWNSVLTSIFEFQYGGTTNRCPSLVKECPGRQTFDGRNDVGWLSIKGCCTLAVTWFSTTTDEGDMALNTRFNWTTDGGSGFDIETVMLHENGHALGLDHTLVAGSIMEASYGGEQVTLGADDLRGVTYLYPDTNWIGSISGTVKDSEGAGISGATVSIADVPVFATTDSSGDYSLDGVPDIGTYDVTASADGYEGWTESLVYVGDNVDFTLGGSGGGGGNDGGGGCVPKGPRGKNCK